MENHSEGSTIQNNLENLNFEDFWEADTKIPNNSEDIHVSTIQSSITAATLIASAPLAATLFGLDDTQRKSEKFSKEVSEYATSKEVISSSSKKIGEPNASETEEDFIERASKVLREILKEKFKI
ncbi:hypothetical protein NIES4072_62750 [Nostoc commune NIES-4072]|uniref:Uncharacterized protein n=1 Tax=Nostoc commune NIES-4072 TaxID=2005467 RepID=A0A2R5G441_NOSCO|nr:hypothetical protein [Nostoc commune]BBD66455.1 hypothetical protein NIES4070_28210 [Nostoc commune HK-02]GBG22564.1 hypothetical protein NIES4072_62750 [Nostoc commune NIES-4072]